MPESFIVIGGGLIGTACALRLQASGYDTLLLDEGAPERAASFGNAGHIAAEQVEPLSSWQTVSAAPAMHFAFGGPLDFRIADAGAWAPWALDYLKACNRQTFEAGRAVLTDLMVRAVDAWSDLLGLAGSPGLMRRDGHAALWFDEREAEAGRRRWAQAATGPARLRDLSEGELQAYCAVMPQRPPIGGISFDGTARLISPQRVRRAFEAAFAKCGGRRLEGRAAAIESDGTVRVGASILEADRILIAAGVHSRRLMEEQGARTPLVAERGYSIQIPGAAWPSRLPTAIVEEQSMVLAPHAEGLRVTSYVELARPDSPPDPAKWERLERRVRELGIPVSAGTRRWMGCRPTLPDYRPAIGAMKNGKILYAFGHQHLGVTLAAVTSERIVALAQGGHGDDALDIRRFAH